MRLTELEPEWLRYVIEDGKTIWRHVETMAEAQGVMFLCPACFEKNSGPIGTHGVVCWSRSRGVPNDATPGPGRWTLDGTGFHDLTLNGDPLGAARSVRLTGGCRWHDHVTNGEVGTACDAS